VTEGVIINLNPEGAMKKFLVLYQAPTSAMEQMAKATPEQSQAGMDAWMSWAKSAGGAIIDLGLPLGNGAALAQGSTSKGTTKIVGYSLLQADSMKTVTQLMESHPHLRMPGFSIDVLEGLPMPGMS
jgi:hypothetical protein